MATTKNTPAKTKSKASAKNRETKVSEFKKDEVVMESPINFVPNVSADAPKFYANFAAVTHSPYDLCIDFCLNIPPHNVILADAKNGQDKTTIRVPSAVRVVIPAEIAEGLANALKSRKESYDNDRKNKRLSLIVEEG